MEYLSCSDKQDSHRAAITRTSLRKIDFTTVLLFRFAFPVLTKNLARWSGVWEYHQCNVRGTNLTTTNCNKEKTKIAIKY